MPNSEAEAREKILLTPNDIEVLNSYNQNDLQATWDILKDPRQEHRFENQADTPHVLSDISRLPKVKVYVARHPQTREIIATASTTDPSSQSREFETWWEHVATRVDMHGRGIARQLGEAIFFERFFITKGIGNKYAENIYTATIIDGDHGPAVKMMYGLGFIPRVRWKNHIGYQTPTSSALESMVREQRGEELRYDSIRWVLTRQMFLLGNIEDRYDFLNRAGLSKEVIKEAKERGIDFGKLKDDVLSYRQENDISPNNRDILDPLGL